MTEAQSASQVEIALHRSIERIAARLANTPIDPVETIIEALEIQSMVEELATTGLGLMIDGTSYRDTIVVSASDTEAAEGATVHAALTALMEKRKGAQNADGASGG